jgi:hypothetical protein
VVPNTDGGLLRSWGVGISSVKVTAALEAVLLLLSRRRRRWCRMLARCVRPPMLTTLSLRYLGLHVAC